MQFSDEKSDYIVSVMKHKSDYVDSVMNYLSVDPRNTPLKTHIDDYEYTCKT